LIVSLSWFGIDHPQSVVAVHSTNDMMPDVAGCGDAPAFLHDLDFRFRAANAGRLDEGGADRRDSGCLEPDEAPVGCPDAAGFQTTAVA
jgi:hypothetical protein